MMKKGKVFQIALTGGPCAGKSTFVSSCRRILAERNIKTITMAEVASELMATGIKYGDIPDMAFQSMVISRMLANERNATFAAEFYREKGMDVVIFYDRGLCDNKAYCTYEEWQQLLKSKGLSDEKLRHRYDAAFNIVTTAYGAEDVWEKLYDNNPQRYERTIEEARETEDRTQAAWAGHHNLKIFGNDETGWEGKEKRMFDAVFSVIGVKPHIRMSNRYLVEVPGDLDGFSEDNNCVVQYIEQTYLKTTDPGIERRLRRVRNSRGAKDVAYYYTEREQVDGGVLTRREFMPKGEREYSRLLLQADPKKSTISKTRYAFTADNRHFVLDVYPENKHPELEGMALLELKEIEMAGKDITLPFGLAIIKDVTDDERFQVSSLA